MANEGVRLYVDLDELKKQPEELEQIRLQLQEYLIGFEKNKQFLANCKYSCYLDIAALDSYDRRLQDALSKLNILKNTLSDICDIYEAYDKKVFVNYDMGNLYAETPWYKTTTFRLVVGTVVVVGSIALAVFCPPSAILSGAAIGSAMGAVTGGVIGGVTAVCHGENFLDGFADGYMWGSVSGVISGTLGAVAEGVMAAIGGVAAKTGAALAARAVVAVCDGAVDAGIYAGQAKLNDGDVTVGGVATTWITGAVMSFIGQTVTAAWNKPAVEGGEEAINLNSQFRQEVTDVVEDGLSSKTLTGTIGDVSREVVENGSIGQLGGRELTGYEYLDAQLGSLKDKVKINQYQSAENVNDWWADNGYDRPPYTPKTVVQDITLGSDTIFVRVYDGDISGLRGGWVMRAEDIKGLTPEQIQQKFALPSTPKYIGEVKLKAGSNIRMGEVNPNYGYNGGGIQFDLKGQYIGEFKEIGSLVDWSMGK